MRFASCLFVLICTCASDPLAAAIPPIDEIQVAPQPAELGQPLSCSLVFEDPPVGPLTYEWDFGDGTGSTEAIATHTYAAPGSFLLRCTVRAGGSRRSVSRRVIVSLPATVRAPSSSGTMVHDGLRCFVVNPDNDSVTAVDPARTDPLWERQVGDDPQALCARDGELWVACRGDDSIHILASADGRRLARVQLAHGAGPAGIAIVPGTDDILVTCSGRAELLRFDQSRRVQTDRLGLGPSPRALAVTADGSTALVTRFLSAGEAGTVYVVDLLDWHQEAPIELVHDDGPDTGDNGRGAPNYLLDIAISPDGTEAWVCAKKDNIRRGHFRDGLPLLHDVTVRNLLCVIDVTQRKELLARRLDVNKQGLISSLSFSPDGAWVCIGQHDNNEMLVIDRWRSERIAGVKTRRGPRGVLVVGTDIFVHAQLSRQWQHFDGAGFFGGTSSVLPELQSTQLVQHEALDADVLRGKQIFSDAADLRMAGPDGYISCSSCHFDGGHDGRTWDFGDRGEGLRNTTTLLGKRGTGHGPLHWTGNFDEIQDFDNDIRNHFGGSGFLSEHQLAGHGPSLGDPKAGLNPELDALAAYLDSLGSVGRSPYRRDDGDLTADAVAGAQIFRRLNCAHCHSGPDFTDSPAGSLHDVGTIRSHSGGRLGGALTGFDTPTLLGLWQTAPYLHDGSAASLSDLIAGADPKHGAMAGLSGSERRELEAFLLQIEDGTTNPGAAEARPMRTISVQVDGRSVGWLLRPGALQPESQPLILPYLKPDQDYLIRPVTRKTEATPDRPLGDG